MTVALAARGMQVTACDSSPAMVMQAQQLLHARSLAGAAQVTRADAHRLPFPEASARLIVALGVVPWLPEPERAVAEMARVLEPGGSLILTADNALRLNILTEPFENPLAAPLRPAYRAYKHRRRRGSPDEGAPFFRHRPSQVRQMLLDAGLQPKLQTTVGFGPLTFMGRPLLSNDHSIALNRRLEGWAVGYPRLRNHGWHYLVMAQRFGGP